MKRGLSRLRSAKRITEIVSLIIMIVYFIHFAAIYKLYPESEEQIILPFFHINVDGGHAPLFLPFAISVAVLGTLIVMDRFPRMFKYPQTITAENIEYQYLMAKIMLNAEIICASIFFDILFMERYILATRGDAGIAAPLLFASAGAAAAVYIIYLTKTVRKKAKKVPA